MFADGCDKVERIPLFTRGMRALPSDGKHYHSSPGKKKREAAILWMLITRGECNKKNFDRVIMRDFWFHNVTNHLIYYMRKKILSCVTQ